MNWDRPILTDSGDSRCFPYLDLERLRKREYTLILTLTAIKYLWGRRKVCRFSPIWAPPLLWPLTSARLPFPQEIMWKNLWPALPDGWKDVKVARLNQLPDTVNKEQLLFGINQGGIIPDIRIAHAKTISEMDLDGYAVGGLAVGKAMRKCIIFWMRQFPICLKINPHI